MYRAVARLLVRLFLVIVVLMSLDRMVDYIVSSLAVVLWLYLGAS